MDVSDSQVDETISLSDVLVARDTCLPEDELWALCRECCLVLEVVNNSPDMFDTLCVTPDTVAFDQVGNVCFLDLDVDPEPIYLAPEYSERGNSYKAHLFSLGMTLLYAAEYNNVEQKDCISPELRELLGHMTADSPTGRPDLESTIILCEEQLCGQSSQEVCCGIATVAGFGLPQEVTVEYLYWRGTNLSSFYDVESDSPDSEYSSEVFEDTAGTTSYITDISPEDYSRAESYLHSELDDTTCCDDIPDLTEDVSQADSLPLSDHIDIIITNTNDESLPLSDETDMENRRRRRVSPQEGKSSWGFSGGVAKTNSISENELTGMNSGKNMKPDVPKKPLLPSVSSDSALETKSKRLSGKVSDGDLIVREFMSESDTDHSRIDSDKSQQDAQRAKRSSSNTSNVKRTNSKRKEDKRTSDSSLKKTNSIGKDVAKDKNQNIKDYNPEESVKTVRDSVSEDAVQGLEAEKAITGSRDKLDSDGVGARTRRSKRKQGLTIADILDALERCLNEEELWALCKEGTAALQRKKKHLPAYLSPDTLLIRESGNVSFKAIPEEKPLEVIFMAPELQTKGELSEKTCLYGLSVTLRCAAGKKYGSATSMSVSAELKDLLQYLSDASPIKRPELADIAKVCLQHSNGSNSDMVCARLFAEAFKAMVSLNAEAFKAMTEKEEQMQRKSPVKEETIPPPPSFAKPSAFKPTSNASFQPVKPAPLAATVGGGAFCPVPKKPVPTKENEISEPRIPSAFSSPATHFKPIILQQTAGSTNEKPQTIIEEKPVSKDKEKPSSKPPSKSSSANSQKKSSPDSVDKDKDKDKEVVKKLKELKENLMKHSKPSLVKELENEDKQSESFKDGVSKSSTPSKKSLPTTPKKSRSSKSSERGGNVKKDEVGGALDVILKEMQRQGNLPDTQSLAAAIAQHLQGHLPPGQSPKGENVSKPIADLDMTVTSAQASLGQDQMLPNLNIPSQYHSQLVGQTMTLPQYGGGMISGLPQFQFQQDPVTGYLQLVPVVTSMRPHSVHSNSGSVHSARDFTSPTGSGTMLKDSPHMSPKTAHNQSDVSNSSAISDPTGSKFKGPHGRTARDLVQKTANMRAKNLGRPSPLLNVNQQGRGGMMKWKSDHALDSHALDSQFLSDGERSKHAGSVSSFPYGNKPAAGYVYDDSMLNASSHRNAQLTGLSLPPGHRSNSVSQFRTHDGLQRVRTHSNSSSPSPSKDSGVSGMNLSAYRALPPGSDVSLMDRLLSNVNHKQQRILGRIVHLLREEFAFDGYMENGVEDVNMAEYIASLGVLKWETFTSAICEKYSDLYWGADLLANLYNAVNGNRPSSAAASRVPASQAGRGQGQRVRSKRSGDNDDDSSSLSEPNDNSGKKTQNRLQPELPSPGDNVQKSKSNNVVNSNRQVDTSDSTDSENYERRRRVKTKHELDKMKNSSSSSGLSDSANTGTAAISQTQANMQTQVVNGNNMIPYSHNDITTIPRSGRKAESTSNITNLPLNHSATISRQHSVDGLTSTGGQQNRHLSPHSASLSQSFDHRHDVRSNQTPQSRNGQDHLNQSQPKLNGSADPRSQGQGLIGSGLSREVSMSSHSSSQSDFEKEAVTMEKKGHVVYHWAMIQLCMTQEMEKFMQGIDEENSKMLHTKLSALEQQLKMEKRVRRKTQKFYKGLMESSRNIMDTGKHDKAAKGERLQKDQLARDITDMTQRISFIELCRSHLQMLLAELQGIDVSYLHSIAICPSCNPLQLHPRPDNPLLQFQTLREPHTGCEIQALHAGSPDGLMAYLFAATALSEGFIHQFLFCFRYFTTATDVLSFLIDRYNSASKAGSTETNISRLQHRVIDLLHFWLEGYYSIDFQGRPALLNTLKNFIRDSVKDDEETSENLLALLSNCTSGNNLELSSADPHESEMHFWQREEPKVKPNANEKKKEWEVLKSLMRSKSKTAKEKAGKVQISAVCVERRHRSNTGSKQDLISRGVSSRRANMFSVSDYTAPCLAEQLCLIEQGMFQLTHPVHYLDSKSRGVGVAMTMQSTRTPAVSRRSGIEESFGLFVEPMQDNTAIQQMIDHAEEVAHWVAAEIVVCSSLKMQVAVLGKFLFTAQACVQLRNFATSMSILSGLENLIIKQLPAWKSLPNKCASIMAELEATRMFLKNDPLSLMQQGKNCHLYPTIPSAVLFLLHIQQAEIGGFKLANQMYKWGKIRSIAQAIDQVRVFREHMYGFDEDAGLQDTLRQRVHDMASQDIQTLAVEHEINYQRLSSAGSGLLKKMKGKLQSK